MARQPLSEDDLKILLGLALALAGLLCAALHAMLFCR